MAWGTSSDQENTGRAKHAAQSGQAPTAKRFKTSASQTEGAPAHVGKRFKTQAAENSQAIESPQAASTADERPVGRRFRTSDVPASGAAQPKQTPTRFRTSAAPDAAPTPIAATSDDAPQPLGAKPYESAQFATIQQGALVPDRETAQEASAAARANLQRGGTQRIGAANRPHVKTRDAKGKVSRPVVIAIVVAIAVVGLVVGIVVALFDRSAGDTPAAQEEVPPRVEQTQAESAQGISYDGFTYVCAQNDDGVGWAFVRTQPGGEPLTLFELQGTPVTEVLFNGTFVIPQNLGESWNVVVWNLGDGPASTELVDSQGNPVQGDGQISSAALDGSNLVLSFDDSTTATFSLA